MRSGFWVLFAPSAHYRQGCGVTRYLLLTGEIPTEAEVAELTATWRAVEALPEWVAGTLDRLPVDTHPMTQFSLGILAMQNQSIFARRYREGMPKSESWAATFDDAMVLLARLPGLAAYVYRRSYRDGGQHGACGGPLFA